MTLIIPNWHPIFVHFTVALILVSALIHVMHVLIDGDAESLKIKTATVANWNLWIGAMFTVVTVIAGWFAYNSVAHDTPSHAAMTTHRNWALGTAALVIGVAIWSYMHSRIAVRLSKGIVAVTVIAALFVGATAWLGGEVVYRYGLGVMSLPKADSHTHAPGSEHDHGDAGGGHEHEHGDAGGGHEHAHDDLMQPEGQADSHQHDEGGDAAQHESLDGGGHDSLQMEQQDSQQEPAPAEDTSQSESHDSLGAIVHDAADKSADETAKSNSDGQAEHDHEHEKNTASKTHEILLDDGHNRFQ